MTKTPEELAQEYVIGEFPDTNSDTFLAAESVHKAFIAGYKAGHAAGFEGAMKIQEMEEIKTVDTKKLIKPTDTVGKEELNCMIAHFENEEYKISVLVPGILPKADGGELVCGCGLIVYDVRKKVTK